MTSISNIARTMKAIRLHEYRGNYHLDDDVPVPSDLDDYDVLISIKTAGFCHTEVLAHDGMFKGKSKELPIIPSHELAVAMGKKVSDVHLNEHEILILADSLPFSPVTDKSIEMLR